MAQTVAGRTCSLRHVGRKIFGVQHRLTGRVGASTRIHHPHQAGQGGYASYRRTCIAGAALLLQCDRRWQAVDRIDVGHAGLVDQAPRIGGHRLEVAPLGLGIEGAEGERGLAGAGDTREHHQRVARDVDVNVLEIVFARAPHLHEAAGCGGTGGFTERRVWHVFIL